MSELNRLSMPIAVYVHLGPNLPKHLKLSLSRHLQLFPSQDLVLITSHDQYFDLPAEVEQFKVDTDTLEAELFKAMSQELDFNFRKGFWKYTLQRFFAIGEFHKANPSRCVTHIESDVLLMPNFPWEKFAQYEKLAWLRVNSEIDVAAVVHFPTLDLTREFTKEIYRLARLKPWTNDMLVLHDAAKNLKSLHEYLPSLTSFNRHEGVSLSAINESHLRYFAGIFDPLNLGLWYFGQDPKNSFGLRKRYIGDESHDLNPVHTKLKYESGVLSDKNGTEIFSLHIHSKLLPLFGPNWESALELGLVEALLNKRRTSFNSRALILALRGRKTRQNIWILISLVPGLGRLRTIRAIESLKEHLKKLFNI